MSFIGDQTFSDGKQDARSWMDGSGWTVSTGRETTASGGARTQASDGFAEPYAMPSSSSSASSGGLILGMKPMELALAIGAIALVAFALKKRKG